MTSNPNPFFIYKRKIQLCDIDILGGVSTHFEIELQGQFSWQGGH